MNNKYYRMNIFTALPKEIIDNILCYTGIIKERNGKYMTQIDKNDYRYKILKTIVRNIRICSDTYAYIVINNYFRIDISTWSDLDIVFYNYNINCHCSYNYNINCKCKPYKCN